MNIKQKKLKSISALGIASLLITGFPALAQADTIPELSIKKIKATSEFIGSNVADGISFTSKYPISTSKSYRLSLFDKVTDKFISSCEQDSAEETCSFEFRNTVNVNEFSKGVHDFQVFLEESDTPLTNTPNSIGSLKNIISKSPVLSWDRKPLTISLATRTPVVDWWSPNGLTEGSPTLDAIPSEPTTSLPKYGYYMVNITENKIVDYEHSSNYEFIKDWTVPFEQGTKSNAYKVILAHGGKDSAAGVKTVGEITDILAESNIVYQHPRTWEAIHECFFDDNEFMDCDATLNTAFAELKHGANPKKTLYIVSGGSIIANGQEEGLAWPQDPENSKYFPINSDVYVADSFTGIAPTQVSQLKNIVFPHPAGTNGSVNPGIQDNSELAGGSNPSIECTPGCYGDPINAFTGEFFETQIDLSMPTVGLPLKASRTFSTQRKDEKGLMGYGWRNSYEMELYSKNDSGVKTLSMKAPTIYFDQENGSLVKFNKQNDGTFRAQNNVKLELIHDAVNNKILVTRDKRDVFTFGMNGRLTQIQDRHNNTLNIAYVSNKISTISDTRGNVMTFAYTSGLLSKVETNQGRKAEYTYSSSRLTKVVNEQGIETSYTYDGQRRVKTLTDALGGVTENFYNTAHQVIRQEDPNDNKLQFAYTVSDNSMVTKITHPDTSTTHDYYAAGMLTKRVENQGKPSSKEWLYSYDGYGNIASEVFPDKIHTSSVYDSNGYLKEHTNALGGVSKFVHDNKGNLLESTTVDGKKTINTYNSKGDLLTTKNALNQTIKFFWNEDGNLEKTIDQKGNETNSNPDDYMTSYGYTTKGQLSSTTDALGNVTKNSYDSLGRLTGVTSPLGSVPGNAISDYTVTTEYDTFDFPSKVIDELKNNSSATYDKAGNILTATDPKVNVTTATYNFASLPLTMTDSDGTTTVTYDNMNRMVTSKSPMGKILTNTYDISGNLIKVTDARGNFVSHKYDSMNRVVSTTDQKGIESKIFYDAMGNVVREVDGKGEITYSYYDKAGRLVGSLDKENNKTVYSYDDLGRLSETGLPTGKKETVTYDANGNKSTRTDPMGNTETWSYDSLNRVISYTDQENKTVEYIYDANSNKTQVKREDSSIIKYEYKRNGLISQVDYPGVDKDATYTYDSLGNNVSQKVGASPEILTNYDPMGRILSRGELNKQISYEYNNDGKQAKIVYPNGRKTINTYDDNGNMLTSTIDGVGTVNYSYDERNSQTSALLPNGVTESMSYDELGRATSIGINKGSEILHKVTREYTANDNVKKSSIGSTNEVLETYSHDTLNRTTGISSAIAGANGLNAYNDANHLTSLMGETALSDKIGKPSVIGLKELNYDTLGNRTQETNNTISETVDLRWNISGELSEVENSVQNEKTSYSYASNGLLSQRKFTNSEKTETNDISWDENNANALMISDGKFEYVYGSNRVPVAQINIETDEIQYLHSDFVGSVFAVTDSESNVESILSYSAYGKRIGVSVSNFGFAGEWIDPTTGYSYNRARWYDSSTAHFLSKDPLVQSTQEAYGYVGGNPLTRIDPSGLFWKSPQQIWNEHVVKPATQAISNVQSAASDLVASGKKAIESVDWDTVNNVITIVGVTAGIAALAIGTGGVGVGVLLAVSGAATATGAGITATQTFLTCIEQGMNENCGKGIANTAMSVLPYGRHFSKGLKTINNEGMAWRRVKDIKNSNVHQRARMDRESFGIDTASINSRKELRKMKNRSKYMVGGQAMVINAGALSSRITSYENC